MQQSLASSFPLTAKTTEKERKERKEYTFCNPVDEEEEYFKKSSKEKTERNSTAEKEKKIQKEILLLYVFHELVVFIFLSKTFYSNIYILMYPDSLYSRLPTL